jgi:hypothetical protein
LIVLLGFALVARVPERGAIEDEDVSVGASGSRRSMAALASNGSPNSSPISGGVRFEVLHAPITRHAAPAGQARRLFEEVQKLPRRQQQKVLDVVSAIVEQFKRKAG